MTADILTRARTFAACCADDPRMMDTAPALVAEMAAEIERLRAPTMPPRRRGDQVTDAELVMHETGIPLNQTTGRVHDLMVAGCKLSMGRLVDLVDMLELVDETKAAPMRKLLEQRQGMKALRELRARR